VVKEAVAVGTLVGGTVPVGDGVVKVSLSSVDAVVVSVSLV